MARRFRVFTSHQNPFTDAPARYVRTADYRRLLTQPGTKRINESGDIQIAAVILDDRRPERVIPRSVVADRGRMYRKWTIDVPGKPVSPVVFG